MKIRTLVIATLALAPLLGAADPTPDRQTAAAFERLKTLAGDWQGSGADGKSNLSYELIAGGATLLERFSSDKEPVMMTMYHLDKNRLLLTHYCAAGNQPRMLGSFNPETKELKFEFLDATNLANPAAGHMHNARIRFVDENHFVSEWDFYENGKKKFTETQEYARVR